MRQLTHRLRTSKLAAGIDAARWMMVLLALLVLPAMSIMPAHALALPKPGICTSEQLPVSLSPGQPPTQTISGTLCLPLYWSGAHPTIDVLVHGATYNSNYWDFPFDNLHYSYVSDTLLAGRATFAYDDIGTIGTGQSIPPDSSVVTFPADVYIMHQVMTWVHAQPAFAHQGKVDVVAHSKGSALAIQELGTYPHDADAFVITGFLHGLTTASQSAATTDLYPANQDPQFAGKNLDDGYETTVPGTRGALFYNNTANPAVVAYDEAHKDIFPTAEFGPAFAQVGISPAQNISSSITIPVLSVVGQQDFFFCGAGAVNCASNGTVQSAEAPFYHNAASFSALVIPNTGHDLALHPSNVLSFAEINAWLQQH